MARLIVFRRLICLSIGPVLHGNDNAARTAARSRTSPPVNPARTDLFAASNYPSSRPACRRRIMMLNLRATLIRTSSSGKRMIRASATLPSFGSPRTQPGQSRDERWPSAEPSAAARGSPAPGFPAIAGRCCSSSRPSAGRGARRDGQPCCRDAAGARLAASLIVTTPARFVG